jgi:hypothetical protein
MLLLFLIPMKRLLLLLVLCSGVRAFAFPPATCPPDGNDCGEIKTTMKWKAVAIGSPIATVLLLGIGYAYAKRRRTTKK